MAEELTTSTGAEPTTGPVPIMARSDPEARGGRPLLLVAYDGAAMSEVQLHMACRSANDIGGVVRVLHVIALPWQLPLSAALSPEDQASVTTMFDRAERIAARYNVPCEMVLSTAHAVGEAVVAEARESQAKVLFIGLRDRRRRGTSLFLSRTLRYVLQQAPCPVQIGYLPAGLPESMAVSDEVVAGER